MEVDKYHFKHLVQNYYMIALSFLNGNGIYNCWFISFVAHSIF